MEVSEPDGQLEPGGHVAIVNSVSGNSVQLVQQNATGAYLNGATWNGSSISIPGSGGWTYPVLGVLHAPGTGGGTGTGTGTGTALSLPAIAFQPDSSLPAIVAEGPNNSLDYTYQAGDGSFHTAQIGGAGSTFSEPSIAFQPDSSLPAVVAQGPDDSLNYIYQTASGSFGYEQVGGAGSTFSAPAIAFQPDSSLPAIVAEGPNNVLDYSYQAPDGGFQTVPEP